MNRGASWAGSQLRSQDSHTADPESPPPEPTPDSTSAIDSATDAPTAAAPPAEMRAIAIPAALAVVAVAWLAIVAAVAIGAWSAGRIVPADLVRGAALASGPLALIVLLLMLWQRTGSREAARFVDAARGVRSEALALDAVLALAARRLADNRVAVAEQADRMLALADETDARLGTATAALAREIAELGRQNRELDATAGTARVDMGVLLADLPIAEAQVRALADTLREAGTGAHERAAVLQESLAALAQRARDAEEANSGAASRLSAQVSRIAGAAEMTTAGIDEVAARMQAAVDAALGRVERAIELSRDGITAQGDAAAAMIERTGAAAEAAGSAAAAAIEARMTALGQAGEALVSTLDAQDRLGATLIEGVQRGLGAIEARFAELDESGRARTERLGDALGTLGQHAERTMATLNDGGTAATTLINRTETLRGAIAACLAELGETLPEAMTRLEAGAARAVTAVSATVPEIARLGAQADAAAATIDAAHDALDRRRDGIEAVVAAVTARVADVSAAIAALDETVAQADGRAEKLADSTGPKLVEALVRVRETAGQAAERAREALGAIVPHSASALGEASRRALETAVGGTVDREIARIAAASAAAVDSAEAAAGRLEAQLGRIALTSASVDERVAAGKAEVEATDRDHFSRRTAQLVDALNSTGIDVARLMAGETSDTAWEAYMRGDRGVFTRRAVRLLDNGEAREVAKTYEADEGFREQVNRYVHDFEALLRPILATRDGSTLAVILLSSDMGKLYVALAQSIERLRA